MIGALRARRRRVVRAEVCSHEFRSHSLSAGAASIQVMFSSIALVYANADLLKSDQNEEILR